MKIELKLVSITGLTDEERQEVALALQDELEEAFGNYGLEMGESYDDHVSPKTMKKFSDLWEEDDDLVVEVSI